MTVVVRFSTSLLDPAGERPNPCNPIAGETLLRWIGERIGPPGRLGEPVPEDWGWLADIDWNGSPTMLGASASEAVEGVREWVLQIIRPRPLLERLRGRGGFRSDDPLVIRIVEILSAEPAFTNLQVESGP